MAGQRRLNHLADAHERRIAARQGLNRHLPAAEKNRLDIEPVLFEKSFVLRHPNMALAKTEGRITEANLFQFLGNDGCR